VFLEIFQKLPDSLEDPSGDACNLNVVSGFFPETAWRASLTAKRHERGSTFLVLWIRGQW